MYKIYIIYVYKIYIIYMYKIEIEIKNKIKMYKIYITCVLCIKKI